MAIPDYQTTMLPLLQHLADQKEHSLRAELDTLADQFDLTQEERKEMLPSGQQQVFLNRLGWARTYLKNAALIEYPRRGFMRITPRGIEVLASKPPRIDAKYLERFPEFLEFRSRRREKPEPENGPTTPEEVLESAYEKIRVGLEDELLQQIKDNSPGFFEHLVVDLLVSMGYGGNRRDAGRAVGQSGDGGIDGIIKEDLLGLDVIYLQAKRWESPVGRPEIQKFAGALQGNRAKKGVFITTSGFSREAAEYVGKIDSKVILIDGTTLAGLMIDHNVGVTRSASYEIKKIDIDYFAEE